MFRVLSFPGFTQKSNFYYLACQFLLMNVSEFRKIEHPANSGGINIMNGSFDLKSPLGGGLEVILSIEDSCWMSIADFVNKIRKNYVPYSRE